MPPNHSPRPTAWADINRGGQTIDSFLEGPSFDRQGRLYVTDIPYGRVFRISAEGEWELVAEYDGWPNGLKIHRDGRIFITAAASTDNPNSEHPHLFQVQIASLECQGDPRVGEVVACAQPNRGEVDLPEFSAERDVVVADLGALLAGVDIREKHGCHEGEDPICVQVIEKLGVSPVDGGPNPSTQTFFRSAPEWSPPLRGLLDLLGSDHIDRAAANFAAVVTERTAAAGGDGVPVDALLGVGTVPG